MSKNVRCPDCGREVQVVEGEIICVCEIPKRPPKHPTFGDC